MDGSPSGRPDPAALLTVDGHADPYPIYRELRAAAPVCRVELPDGRWSWLVTRHADVVDVLSSDRFASDPASVDGHRSPGHDVPLGRLLTTTDPPEHTRLRAAVRRAFTPAAVEALRPRVTALAEELAAAIEGRGPVDLLTEYAFPLPIVVVAEMLGLPAEDRDLFREWSRVVIDGDFPMSPEEVERRARVANEEIVDYLHGVFAAKRARPDDGLVSDLLGSDLTPDELVGMVWLLLADGYESVACTIGSGVVALLRHPDQLARLRADPSLVGPAVEELLRYECPAATLHRHAVEDVDLDGCRVAKGDLVTVVLSSANRDEAVFDDPDRLDVGRSANRHVAFGRGVHFCIGAALARMECQIGIGTLVRLLPRLRLAVPAEELTWRPSLILRGLRSLPVEA